MFISDTHLYYTYLHTFERTVTYITLIANVRMIMFKALLESAHYGKHGFDYLRPTSGVSRNVTRLIRMFTKTNRGRILGQHCYIFWIFLFTAITSTLTCIRSFRSRDNSVHLHECSTFFGRYFQYLKEERKLPCFQVYVDMCIWIGIALKHSLTFKETQFQTFYYIHIVKINIITYLPTRELTITNLKTRK